MTSAFGTQHIFAAGRAIKAAGRAVANVVPFQVNKYIRMGLSLFIVLLGFFQAVDWAQFMTPEHAGAMFAMLGIIKFCYNSFAPGLGVSTIPTSSNIITQKAEPQA